MQKKSLNIITVTVMVIAILAGCGNMDSGNQAEIATTETVNEKDTIEKEEAVAEITVEEEVSDGFVISNDHVKVVEYKGLKLESSDVGISDEDVNSFIEYLLQNQSLEDNSDAASITAQDLTDEMVVSISDGLYDNVADYIEYVKGVLEAQNEVYYEENSKKNLFEEVLNKSELVSYEDERLQNYIDYAKEYYSEYAEYLGVDIEKYVKENLNLEDMAAYEKYVSEEALETLKREYIIKAIAENEGVKITDDQIDLEVKNYIEQGYFENEEETLAYISRDEIKTNLEYNQILDIIYAFAVK